jgi:ABC-type multidrug transport system fused ATPase/permease subunit
MTDIKEIIKFILPYWKKYWKQEILVFFLLALIAIINLNIPLYFKDTIDAITGNVPDSDFFKIIITFVALAIASSIISWGYVVYITYLGESLIIDITSDVYSKILDKRRSFWVKFAPNDVLTRLTQDILSVKSFIFDFIHSFLLQTVTLISIVIILFTMSSYASVLIVCHICAILVLSYWGNNFLTYRSFKVRELASRFTDLFQKGLSYPDLNFSWKIKDYHKAKYQYNASLMKAEQVKFVNQMQTVNQSFGIINILIGSFALIIVLRVEFLDAALSIGTFMAVLVYASRSIQIASDLSSNLVATKINRSSVLRIREILLFDNKAAITYPANGDVKTILHPFFKGKLNKGINLPKTEKYLFKLDAENGTGKSTFAKVLTGYDDLNNFYFNEGEWFIALSDSPVFEGNLLDNIRLISGKQISEEEIITMLTKLNLDKLMQVFPGGFQTQFADHNPLVSQGQKQAMQLIAGIVSNPEQIVLDEAINSLDKETKMNIKIGLESWLRERKSVVIEHGDYFNVKIETMKENVF